MPIFVNLEVTGEESFGNKNDTSSPSHKKVYLSTNAILSVPLFIKIGDIVKIDTREGIYTGRALKGK